MSSSESKPDTIEPGDNSILYDKSEFSENSVAMEEFFNYFRYYVSGFGLDRSDFIPSEHRYGKSNDYGRNNFVYTIAFHDGYIKYLENLASYFCSNLITDEIVKKYGSTSPLYEFPVYQIQCRPVILSDLTIHSLAGQYLSKFFQEFSSQLKPFFHHSEIPLNKNPDKDHRLPHYNPNEALMLSPEKVRSVFGAIRSLKINVHNLEKIELLMKKERILLAGSSEPQEEPEKLESVSDQSERNEWFYDQVCSGEPYKSILIRFNEIRQNGPDMTWDSIKSTNGIRQAAQRYAIKFKCKDPLEVRDRTK
jgi:hypothetical protein